MAEMMEIIFESIKPDSVKKLLSTLIDLLGAVSKLELQGYNYSIDSIEMMLDHLCFIKSKIKEGYPLIIVCDYLMINNVTMHDVLVRLYSYENDKYDLDIVFDLKDSNLNNNDQIKKLHEGVLSICSTINIENILFGYEPASDEDTQLFKNDKLGPLFLNKK